MGLALGHDVNENIITNKEVYGNVSNKFINTSTEDIIDEFNKYMDIKPVGFSASHVRKPEKENKQKHMIMLEPADAQMPEGTLRLVIFNSLDRSTAIRIYLGYYRNACSNNCVFGPDLMEPIHIKHTYKDWKKAIKRTADSYQSVKFNTEQEINHMLNKYMTYDQQGRYAQSITDIVNKDITGRIIDPMEFNIAHRVEDVGNDLWHTYQRIQYNVMNGGIQRSIRVEKDITLSNTHKVKDQAKQLKYNLALYDEAKKHLQSNLSY